MNQARNGQILVNFGQKWPFSNFPQNSEPIIFFRLKRPGLKQQARDAGSLDLSRPTLNFWFLKRIKGIKKFSNNFKIANVLVLSRLTLVPQIRQFR